MSSNSDQQEQSQMAPTPAPAQAPSTPTPSSSSSSSSSGPDSRPRPSYKRAQAPSPSPPPRLTFKHDKFGILDVSRILDHVATDLTKRQFVGKGAWASVYKGKLNATGENVAVKIIVLAAYGDKGEASVRNEIRCHAKASRLVNGDVNPYVLPILRSFIDLENGFGCIITALSQWGTLSSYLTQFVVSGMPDEEAYDMIMKLAIGIVGMHDAGVLHLDLKGGNIVLRHDPETNHFDPMIADFGCAALTDYDDREDGRWLRKGCGTLPYRAPDRRGNADPIGGHYTVLHARKSDGWALGVIIGIIFGGILDEDIGPNWHPRKDRQRTLDRVKNTENSKLINKLLNVSVSTRMSVHDFVQKAWHLPLVPPGVEVEDDNNMSSVSDHDVIEVAQDAIGSEQGQSRKRSREDEVEVKVQPEPETPRASLEDQQGSAPSSSKKARHGKKDKEPAIEVNEEEGVEDVVEDVAVVEEEEVEVAIPPPKRSKRIRNLRPRPRP